MKNNRHNEAAPKFNIKDMNITLQAGYAISDLSTPSMKYPLILKL